MRLTGYTLLIVEDDIDNLELLAAYLAAEGATVLTAQSVSEALAAAEQEADALVADLELADGDGCSVLRALRDRPTSATLPAIALTGYSDDAHRREAMSCGFDHYAVKPCALDELVELLVELIQRRSGPRASSYHVASARVARGLRGR